MQPMTSAQARVLRFIEAHKRKVGWPPSIREIQVNFGWASLNAATQHLKALERKGYIRREPSLSRGITIL